MAQRPTADSLPCLFCGKGFRNLRSLTTHLDIDHEKWIDAVMTRMGLTSPAQYPIQEYRLALAQALLVEDLPTPEE